MRLHYIERGKRMKRVIGIVLVFFLCFSFSGCSFSSTPNKSDLGVVVEEQNSKNPKWTFGNGEKYYEIGLNNEKKPVFKNPDEAFAHFTVDYADAIEAIRVQFKLSKISKDHWMGYNNLGWQFVTEDDSLRIKANDVTSFLDFYKNGFKITSPNDFA